MASHERGKGSPPPNEDNIPTAGGGGGPPSIISSRMTDIASEDGGERETDIQRRPSQRRSGIASESRPGTARTGVSSSRSGWPQSQPLRKNYLSGLAAKRGSVGAGSTAGSLGRSPSTKSRSHVPSLQSHAFFHPMSSQKLQAQRGGPKPPAPITQQSANLEDAERETTPTASMNPNPQVRLGRQLSDDGEFHHPPSPGTEMTGQETLDRITANTSPTHGHHPQASLSESMRPLQKKPAEGKSLAVRVDKSHGGRTNLPPPLKSPRSFRSSFLLPTSNAQNAANRNLEGAEKLSSGASSPQLEGPESSKKHAVASTGKGSKVGRVFEFFEGNTVFCLGGRWQNARSKPVNIATGLFVIIPGVLFGVFSAPWLWQNVSPAIPLVFAYLFYLCLSSFIHASVSDPGILPRNLHQFPPPEDDDPYHLGPPTNDWVIMRSSDGTTAAMEVPVKHCRTCNIWRPPRAHHCRLCDNCIETHDHHCVWLNNCVGRRNYRYFFSFVASCTIIAIYLIAMSLIHILVWQSQHEATFGQAIDKWRVPFAMVIYGVVGGLYPLALMGYHIFLMARGETTREYINSHKFVKNERYRAFTQGNWLKNWVVVLCRPRPPTYYQFKNTYQRGDQRLAEDKLSKANKRERDEGSQGMEMQSVRPAGSAGFQGPVGLRNESASGGGT